MKSLILVLLLTMSALLSFATPAQDATDSKIKIYLTNGAMLEVDDAKFTAVGVWVRGEK